MPFGLDFDNKLFHVYYLKYNAMIMNFNLQKKQAEQRLILKTLDHIFLKEVEEGTDCSPFEAKAILSLVKKIYPLEQPLFDDNIKSGQMKVIGIASDEPSGKILEKCRMKECIITIHNGMEDDTIRAAHGVVGLRRAVILRIAAQAYEQGVLLTHEDIAFHILRCGLRTLARDIAYFKEHDIFVPTRGQKCDIGPGISHKVKAVELLLQRKNDYEIARSLYHSIESIERYTQTFIRIVFLTRKGFQSDDIAFTLHISLRLANQYLDLYNKYNDKEHQQTIQDLIMKFPDIRPDQEATDKKKPLSIYQLYQKRRKS
jgi:hypothetical protein